MYAAPSSAQIQVADQRPAVLMDQLHADCDGCRWRLSGNHQLYSESDWTSARRHALQHRGAQQACIACTRRNDFDALVAFCWTNSRATERYASRANVCSNCSRLQRLHDVPAMPQADMTLRLEPTSTHNVLIGSIAAIAG